MPYGSLRRLKTQLLTEFPGITHEATLQNWAIRGAAVPDTIQKLLKAGNCMGNQEDCYLCQLQDDTASANICTNKNGLLIV